MHADWREMLAREGVLAAPGADGPDGSLDLSGDACPACGCALPLRDGACADCGLQLE